MFFTVALKGTVTEEWGGVFIVANMVSSMCVYYHVHSDLAVQ